MGTKRNQYTIKRLIALTVLAAVFCALIRPIIGNELALLWFVFYAVPLSIWGIVRLPRIRRELKELRELRTRSLDEIEQLLAVQKKKADKEIEAE